MFHWLFGTRSSEPGSALQAPQKPVEEDTIPPETLQAIDIVFPNVRRCQRDGFEYPAGILPVCPQCLAAVEQQELPVFGLSRLLSCREYNPSSFLQDTIRDLKDMTSFIHPPPPLREPPAAVIVTESLRAAAARADFVGAGNTLLEVLLLTPLCGPVKLYEHRVVLPQLAVELVAARFGLPPDVHYELPHRDRHLHVHLRGDWMEDSLRQLIIDAFVIGATWRALPFPHNRLLAYYQLMATRQSEAIRSVAAEYRRAAPPTATAADVTLDDQIRTILNNGRLTDEEKMREIQSRRRTDAAPPHRLIRPE